MEEINEELTLFDFKNAIEELHKKLNLNEKHVLYNQHQKHQCKWYFYWYSLIFIDIELIFIDIFEFKSHVVLEQHILILFTLAF